MFGRAKNLIAAGESWDQFRNSLILTASVNLKRKLEVYEQEILRYPRVCEVCRDSKAGALACCPNCNSVFYCSAEHKDQDAERHQKYCKYFLLLLECDRVESEDGVQDLPFPIHVDTVYRNLPDKIMTLLNPQLQRDSAAPLDPKSVTMITERLSYPLSLLYAIQNVGLGSENTALHDITSMTVHVVGAKSFTELLGIIRWEYMVHRLPALRTLRMVFIGPELLTDNTTEAHDIPDHILDDSCGTMCDQCKSQQRTIVYEMVNSCYDEFNKAPHYSKPDVVVAYNCGFHEHQGSESTWTPSLPLLVSDPTVPVVFTSYNAHEASLDLKAMQEATDVKILMAPHKNPFSSLRPYREVEVEIPDAEPVHFWNQYITCVRRA